ncbi:hypothetical protein ACWKSP_00440 [Micromonosporaceae bacterium Da 78-11]
MFGFLVVEIAAKRLICATSMRGGEPAQVSTTVGTAEVGAARMSTCPTTTSISAANLASMSIGQTLVQLLAPPADRGRVIGVDGM